jgi:AraC family transcriptional regulator
MDTIGARLGNFAEPGKSPATQLVKSAEGLTGNVGLGDPASLDPVFDNFVRGLLPPQEAGRVLSGVYTDALHSALLMRLAALRRAESIPRKGGARPLPSWRLKRVYDFVEANIENRILLHMLASAAGVSRMYFAAQFRAATGMRPHSYVLQRRMAHARKILSQPESTIVDTAFSVGFQTQAHFTTVFKEMEGITPHRWRELHGPEALRSFARQ